MRIVSLPTSGTEMEATLGLEEALVGISHACDFPASVAALRALFSRPGPGGDDGAESLAGLLHRQDVDSSQGLRVDTL